MTQDQKISNQRLDNEASFLEIVLKSIPGGAIAGGFVSWVMARKKIREDSVAKIVDLQIDLISEIHLYWSLDSRDRVIESTIVRLFQRFSNRVRVHLTKYGNRKSLKLAMDCVTRAHVAITGSPFSTSSWRRAVWRSTAAKSELENVAKFVK